MRSLLIEPQRIFVPALWSLLAKAGLNVEHAIDSLKMQTLIELQPQFVFFDIDFVEGDPVSAIRSIRLPLPVAIVCVYASTAGTRRSLHDFRHAGADGIISKSVTEPELIDALQTLMETGSYSDWRSGKADHEEFNDAPRQPQRRF